MNGLNCSVDSVWDPPGPGIEPVSAALADGFFTIEPPGKTSFQFFLTAGIKWSFGRKKEISLHPIKNFLGSDNTIKKS